jgi:hypothetical protein
LKFSGTLDETPWIDCKNLPKHLKCERHARNVDLSEQEQRNKNLQRDQREATIHSANIKSQLEHQNITKVNDRVNMAWESEFQLPEIWEPNLNAYYPGNSRISLEEQQEQFMNSMAEMDDYREHVLNQESEEEIDDFTLPGVPIIGIDDISMLPSWT